MVLLLLVGRGAGLCTWKSLWASVIMLARPWVAARFSLRSR